jgi:hypothetical protein
MRTRTKLVSLTGALAVIGQFFIAGTALAHHPYINGTAVCDDSGSLVINYDAGVNSTRQFECENPEVYVYLNGTESGPYAFVYPGCTISGTLPGVGDAANPASIGVLAAGTWLDGATGGQSYYTDVTYPEEPCVQSGFGRFTGGGHQIRVDGVRVTRGLTIHCDLLLSNNLEVNWNGNQFHMTEHLSTVECSDSPDIVQFPPDAPLDTLVGVGTGRYNGVDGFTIEFTLVDYGEPGSSDRMAIKIFETADPGNVVLDIPEQVLSGGNLQAHYDQPHK